MLQNLRQPDGPLDGRFGRINISLQVISASPPRSLRFIGQQTLQGIHLHPLVRAKLARRCADALEQAALHPDERFIPFDDTPQA